MNKLAIVIALWITVGLDMALRASFTSTGATASYAPSVTLALVALIAAFAPLLPALAAAFIAGLLLDLTQTHSVTASAAARLGDGAITIVGPHALACLAGAYLVTRCRSLFLRRNPFSLAVLAALCAVVTHAGAMALLLVRTMLDADLQWMPQAGPRLLSGLLTTIPGFLLGLSWRWLLPPLGIADPFGRQGYANRTTV